MTKQKYNTLRIFPYLLCCYRCSYCSAYTQFNTELRYKEFKTLPAQIWIDALNRQEMFQLFEPNYQIVVSGGEPTLWKEFKEFCDGMKYRNMVIYSNISKQAYNKLCGLEKPVKLYPSFHAKEEMRLSKHSDIHEAYKAWYRRVLDLKLCGHKIYMVHCPDDGLPAIQELGSYVLKTRIEGIYKGEFYSPYVNECRVRSKEMKTVQCHTQHFCVAPDGDIYNCQANLWSKREGTVIANIQDVNWSEFPEFINCDWCGACHACAQQKAILDLDGNLITDEFQYKPLLDQLNKNKA